MNSNVKKLTFIFIILLMLICPIFFASCTDKDTKVVSLEKTSTTGLVDTYTITYSDGSTFNFEITNGKNGINGKDGKSLTINEIYEFYIKEYGNISYADFLKQFLQLSSDNSYTINECLLSSLKVYTEFTTTTSYWYNEIKSLSINCGSAVIYKMYEDTTYILTNYHVVYNYYSNSDNGGKIARKIYGYLYGSEDEPTKTNATENGYDVYDYGDYAIELEYVGGSIAHDIAVLKVDTQKILAINQNAQAVKLADNYYVGETAIAIGNPENEGISATQGIVSVDNEYISLQMDELVRKYRSIRIDTSIYGGSSGGGLFNKQGELIGLTNAGDKNNQNINYAIPIQIVKAVANNILYYKDSTQSGTIKQIALGIQVATSNSQYVYDQSTGYGDIKETVTLSEVVENSIAKTLDLQVGDIIKSIFINENEYKINRSFDIADTLLNIRETDKIKIAYNRNSQNLLTEEYTILISDLK